MTDVTTACIYARYSSHNQTEQSIEGQVRVCKEFCERERIAVTEIYADRATSASKDIDKREEFLRMIKDAEKHPFDAVIVYKLDRFARSRYDSANYKYKLKKAGVRLISATENITDTPEGIILESVLEGMAEFYSAELSQKVSRGMRESALKHNWVGGIVPLGYKIVNKKYVVDEETAPIVRQAFKLYADGHSLSDIVSLFNAKGYKTSKGKEFTFSSFSLMLKNERYIGTYIYHDYKVENAIPAIIDKELFEEVQNILSQRKKYRTKGVRHNHQFLLLGKLYCGECGNVMYGIHNQREQGYYTCSQRRDGKCSKSNVKQSILEEIVWNDAKQLLTEDRIHEIAEIASKQNEQIVYSETQIPYLKGRLEEIEKSITNLTIAIECGSPPKALVERLKELEKEKSTVLSEMKKEEATALIITPEHIEYFLLKVKEGIDTSDQFSQALVDMFIKKITIWEDGKIIIEYNLSTLPPKNYKFENTTKGEPFEDFQISGCILRHEIKYGPSRKTAHTS